MGGTSSSTPPSPSLVYEKPWITVDWTPLMRRNMVEKLENTSQHSDMDYLRILLHGPVGAGKSSFINSVKSVFTEHVVVNVLAENNISAIKSFTTKYQTHHIRGKTEERLPFILNDVMGLQTEENGGVHPDDIKLALKGHVTCGYMFNPTRPLTDDRPEYNHSPSLSDKVHCLVSVVSADSISRMDENVIAKLRAIRVAAADLNIPQLAVMTMPDKACPEVNKDLKNIDKSKEIKKKMETVSLELGIPMNCILPVKNYSEQTQMDNDTDILVLRAITHIVHAANDHIWSLQQHRHLTGGEY